MYLKVVFCSARKIFCYFLEYKNGTFRDFAVSGCRILRTIQKTKFESLKLKSSDEKPNFSAYFCQKNKITRKLNSPQFFFESPSARTSPGRQITNRKSRGFLRKNRFIHVLEMSKSTQNKQLYLDVNTKKVLVRRFMFQSIFY